MQMLFPICHGNHWFLFVVDLKNKLFVFLDSIFGETDAYQIQAKSKLINAFKEAWYEHAEVKIDLEDFSTVYPLVPKQKNCDDCGIFVIKFMELWDLDVDLRSIFSQSDIPNIRVKLGYDIFFSRTNKVDKSLVNQFYKENVDPRLCR
ncbi:hypothetical protein QOZ80_1BG0081660 [Eleusine coracana subsp. coracana]|nr:hypothetical protein QOZ80_1BG0081660 [Eleusine coracana subsp. coracana]